MIQTASFSIASHTDGDAWTGSLITALGCGSYLIESLTADSLHSLRHHVSKKILFTLMMEMHLLRGYPKTLAYPSPIDSIGSSETYHHGSNSPLFLRGDSFVVSGTQ